MEVNITQLGRILSKKSRDRLALSCITSKMARRYSYGAINER